MGKLKQTKLKHRKHKDGDGDNNSVNQETHKKYKLLTSKNKNKLVFKEGRYYRKNVSMNKKHKRSQKHFNVRTLDVLKKYGSTLKNQDGGFGGFIVDYLKFKLNMRQIKKIIAKLGKNQKDINEFIDSYKKQPETFKRLGDKKAVIIYDIIRTEKERTIIQFLLENRDQEKTYDTSTMQHDLDMINTKIEIATSEQLKQLNKEIEKEKPLYEKNKEKFEKDSKKFEVINKDYSKLMAFYEEQKELSDRYHSIEKDEKLTKQDKEIKKKYKKNEENIKYILSYKQEDISAINDNVKKLATLMNMSRDYDEKFKGMTQDYYNADLQKWQGNYKAIYENISTIEGGIKSVSDTLEKIKEYADQIGSNLSSIYGSIKQNFKLDPILKIKRIIDENLGYLKNVKEVSIKKVKYAFIEQIPIEQIEFYLPLAEAALIQTEKSMNELNASFILDSSFIRTGHAGGGKWQGMEIEGMDIEDMDGLGIGELEWFGKGGATAMSYDVLLKLNIDTFLETDYKDIIKTLETMNTDLNDATYNSDIYKLKNYEFLNIMKIYFNIYIFFLHYFKSRDSSSADTLNPINNTVPSDTEYKDNNRCILNLLSIITKYEIIIKDNKDSIFKELPNTVKTEIQNYISNVKVYLFGYTTGTNFITEILSNIKTNYFDKLGNDKNIWNPFRENDNLTLKNLYYEYNPHASTANDLDCIKSFIGYYNKKDKHIIDYENRSESDLNKSNLFAQGALHNKYDDIPVIYKYNDGAGFTEYKFIVIYDNKIMKNGHPSIKIKVCDKSDAIDEKFNNFINFLAAPEQLNKPAGNLLTELKHNIYNSTKYIKDDYDNLYCNFDSNTLFEKIINDKINKAPYLSKICDNSDTSYIWSMSYMKHRIINLWNALDFIDNNTANSQTILPIAQANGATKTDITIAPPAAAIPAGNGLGVLGAVVNNKTFKDFYHNEFDWLKTNIIPLILRNIYNNVKYDETIQYYTVDRATNFTNLNKTDITTNPKLLTILEQKDKTNHSYYIIVYEFDNTGARTIIKKEIIDYDNKSMQKYLFTWLKSDANSDDTKKPTTDTISDFIYKLYENTSKTKTLLSTLDVSNIVKNEICNAFSNEDRKEFIKAYTNAFDDNLKLATKYAVVLKEDKVINTLSNPIVSRTESRLVFDLPQSDKFNEEDKYNSGSSDFIKNIVLDTITKSYNKKGNYKNIPIKYVKRIVSFNVNNWNRSIDSIALINPKPDPPTLLLTDPKNAITFIKTKLPDTDVLGFLDYSLYPNGTAANRHIKDKVKTTTNEADITVDNKYTEELIKNELKLDNYFIKNDNYDNIVDIPILGKNDNMFLGKALYYDDKKTTMSKPEPLCNTSKANDILYSEILINKKPIGLYLINIYTPLKNKSELDTLIKTCIDTHTKSHNLYETVIMGTFTLETSLSAYTKEVFIDDMKVLGYNQFGNIKETCINKDPTHYYIDLCFVSDDFEKQFTIINDDIVVPSGSVSSHYPIYLDIIENQDIDIEDDDFIVFYSNETIEIKDKFSEFTFNLTLKKKPTVGGSKGSAISKPKPKYTPKSIKIASDGSYDIEMVDSSGTIITDDRYKTASIDKITNIISIKDKNGNTRMTIDKGSRKITRFEEDGTTVESTSVIDKDGTFITTDKDGKEYKTKDGADGKPETKDISTGEVVKSYYDAERDEIEKAKQEGKRLLSTFMDDINKQNITTIVSKNKDSILSYIKKILDLIQTKLKHDSYDKITTKINALSKNIIELKSIEPKLTPDKVLIKEYAQKARSYSWMEDVTKREKVSLSLEDEAKELQAIIKDHPEIKDILPSSGENISREELLELTSSSVINPKNRTLSKDKESIRKILKKLENSDNVKKLVEYLRKEYESDSNNLCNYLVAIMTSVNSKLLTELYENFVCIKNIAKQKEDEKAKYKK